MSVDKGEQTAYVGKDILTIEPTKAQLAYVADDVRYLHRVMDLQLERLQRHDLLRVTRLEMAFMPALAEMVHNGFFLNVKRHAETLPKYVEAEARTRAEVVETLTPLYNAWVERQNVERRDNFARLEWQAQELLGGPRATKNTPQDVKDVVAELRKQRNRFKPLPLADEANPFNPGSQQQVWIALAEAGVELWKEDYAHKEGRKKSIDKFTIKEYLGQHPILPVYAEWAKAAKVISTYGETLREQVNTVTGRVHSDYNQMVDSGRLSSRKPNLQNVPPDIRANFEAQKPGDVLIVADAKNQEGRLAAVLSRDPNLLSVFREDKDWHSMTAARAWPELFKDWTDVPKDSKERARAKNGNFSSIYGGTAYTLKNRGYVDDLVTGERIMEAVAENHPVLTRRANAVADRALEEGVAETISGRKRFFRLGDPPRPRDFINASGTAEEAKAGKEAFEEAYSAWKRRRGGIRRSAMNHPVQGSGADIMKQAMVFLRHPMQALGFKLVATVHDEIVYEGPAAGADQAAQLVAKWMLEAGACYTSMLPIPGDVHIVRSWVK